MDLAEQLIADIERFRTENGCDRLVIVWCASTEAYRDVTDVHQSIEAFEQGLRDSDPLLSPSQIYAYAALISGAPFANGHPNPSTHLPCMVDLSLREAVPLGGQCYKTGQPSLRTLLSPGLQARTISHPY